MSTTVSDVLSKASGLNTKEISSIFQEVKRNAKLLDECPGPHRFTIKAGRREFADDFICEICGGQVQSIYKIWYEKGLEHGKKV